jgi:hypothetical protein
MAASPLLAWPPKLRVTRGTDGRWWIVGGYCRFDMGPYDTRKEAEEDVAGLYRGYAEPGSRRWHMRDMLTDRDAWADSAEYWCEAVKGRPSPPRGTLNWDKMYEAYVEAVFA